MQAAVTTWEPEATHGSHLSTALLSELQSARGTDARCCAQVTPTGDRQHRAPGLTLSSSSTLPPCLCPAAKMPPRAAPHGATFLLPLQGGSDYRTFMRTGPPLPLQTSSTRSGSKQYAWSEPPAPHRCTRLGCTSPGGPSHKGRTPIPVWSSKSRPPARTQSLLRGGRPGCPGSVTLWVPVRPLVGNQPHLCCEPFLQIPVSEVAKLFL